MEHGESITVFAWTVSVLPAVKQWDCFSVTLEFKISNTVEHVTLDALSVISISTAVLH